MKYITNNIIKNKFICSPQQSHIKCEMFPVCAFRNINTYHMFSINNKNVKKFRHFDSRFTEDSYLSPS